ncbi:MAG: phosphatase PAP2 family protein [Gammaproteobacteria bacterium]|nr:phosphatase PAP2 family protein [Gammaproteobacteria bacterium]
MLQHIIHSVILYLNHHPHSAGIITFFIAFSEALAIIGTIVPGSVTMTAIGALIGSQVIPAYSTIVLAMCGAVAGDLFSYLIGIYYKKRLHNIWPFKKHPNLLKKGEEFFAAHGGKSIILGRFIGPVRSMVPLIAGSLKMSFGRFLLAAIPSACLWAILYMTPGIFLGAISLELPPGIALKFILSILIIISFIILLMWLIRFLIWHSAKQINNISRRIWVNLQRYKSSHWLTKLLTTTDPQLKNHQQLRMLIYVLLCSIIFLILAISVLFTHGILLKFNHPLYHLLTSIRFNLLDNIIIIPTVIFSPISISIYSALFFIWLLSNKQFRIAMHWIVVFILSSGATEFFKLFFYNARPITFYHINNLMPNSSFPSGHTMLTTTFVGFLAIIFAQSISKNRKYIPYTIATITIITIAFSRLYLGAHWLTDVAAGAAMGMAILLLVTISYHRTVNKKFPLLKNLIAIIVIFSLVGCYRIYNSFSKDQKQYALSWPSTTISITKWLRTRNHVIPRYRLSRFGRPKEAFNIEWLGNLSNITKNLQHDGWQVHNPKLNIKTFIYRLAGKHGKQQLPLLPQTYQNRYPSLLMTKITINNQLVLLRLWKSNIKIQKHNNNLWLGIVNYYQPPHKLLNIPIENHQKFIGATKILEKSLNSFHWKKVTANTKQQKESADYLRWNGELLLIYP